MISATVVLIARDKRSAAGRARLLSAVSGGARRDRLDDVAGDDAVHAEPLRGERAGAGVHAHRGAGAAVNGVGAASQQRAGDAAQDVAGSRRRERRRRAGADRHAPVGRGDERVVALQYDDRAAAPRCIARVVQAPASTSPDSTRAGGRARRRAA